LRVILAIMDGFGCRRVDWHNAIARARTPHLTNIFRSFPAVQVNCSGLDVGLPDGLMGNSEVGHLNIGAGRVVYQDIVRIDKAVASGEFYRSPVLLDLISDLKSRGRYLHVMGLISNGGVHASLSHLMAVLELCRRQDFRNVVLHAFTDGRDTPPKSGIGFIGQVEGWMSDLGVGRIQTVIGRYYAMDRDKRWDRVEKAYRAICFAEGRHAPSAPATVESSYAEGVTDEFILPTVVDSVQPPCPLTAEDGVFFINFRADRARQLTDALVTPDFNAFPATVKLSHYATMTRYREEYTIPIVFQPQHLTLILGEVVSASSLKQLRIAETEKYPHVTFFFNGGDETPFPGEERILVPSPKVATYDLQPEMSAPEVTQKLCDAIRSDKFDFIVVNFANCDMVGHTGIMDAIIKAVETVDDAIGKVCDAAKEHDYAVMLTADHGNAETTWDYESNGPHTAHTTDPVPLALINGPNSKALRDGGRLADIAPTILQIMQLPQPAEMTGHSLLRP
jgi:2,3-bisphosphoglycerate-independent phosphoglycerate mutase